jgi:pimeloyl-ACP methyl ester carboxylesterase
MTQTSATPVTASGLGSPTGHESGPAYRLDGLVAADHYLQVPLDHLDLGRGATTVYARELRAPDKVEQDLPYLVFLQGGPGGASPRPDGGPGWIRWAVDRYRVLLLDQRGTGRSDPLDPRVIQAFGSPQEQADTLALYRADSIVRDCEALRRLLLGDGRWSTLGQSFGGFCTFTYLSFAPQALRECYVTGGIPALGRPVDDNYRSTYRQILVRTADLDAEFPRVRTVLRSVAEHIQSVEERLPDGEVLTVERLQEIGHVLGQENGPLRLHYLAECAWAGDRLSQEFLHGVHALIGLYATAPLYALIHECCGLSTGEPTRWSAERVRAEVPQLDAPDGPLGLTGEAIYRHTIARQPALAPFMATAELLAERVWARPLFDLDALSRNEVPVAAQVYTQDMYVPHDLSVEAAAVVPGVRVVEDPERHHDGLRKHGRDILTGLRAVLGAEAELRGRSGGAP